MDFEDICQIAWSNVRIAPESGPQRLTTACRMSASNRHMQRNKVLRYSITSSASRKRNPGP
jgi:hypothetical protein